MMKKFVKLCLSGIPLLLGLILAFLIFSGNLVNYGLNIPTNQTIRIDFLFAIAVVLIGGILTTDFVGFFLNEKGE